jgi:L-lactate dehydrogenase
MGWVGASVAISTLHAGAADELWLHDLNGDVAEGEAMDLAQGALFYPTAQVRTASIEEMRAADVVVVTAGRNGRPDQSRLDLLRVNADIIREIGRQLAGMQGIIVMVSNPVDVLTRVMVQASGLPPARVIGTGTMLDSARLRHVLGGTLQVDPQSVHAQVLGEHGDSELVLWSGVSIGGVPLRQWPGWDEARESMLADQVRTAAYQIIRRKGATNHAIGLVTAQLLSSMLRGERRVLTVSRVQQGVAGLHDVALSLPAIVSREGAGEVLAPQMNDDERAKLLHSASVLQAAFEQV